MASDESAQLPSIFLSHSGEQKGFVWSLYRALKAAHYKAFFDQDAGVKSLPKGIPFPSRIRDACRACKVGVVVLSHQYIESLWPMLELQQFFFNNPHEPVIIPLFYELKPGDLTKEENWTRWRQRWSEKEADWMDSMRRTHLGESDASSSISDETSTPDSHRAMELDTSLWSQALEMLRFRSGQTRPDNKDDDTYIREIVANIAEVLPPPLRYSLSMGPNFKGAENIQKTIHALYERQQQKFDELGDASSRKPISVGLYGFGGSGKTDVCKCMLNFYSKEYKGRSCFLSIPSSKNDIQSLVESMKEILDQVGDENEEALKKVNTIYEVMPYFEGLLKKHRVFLVIDGFWEWARQSVEAILTSEYVPGSRLLVTARSKGLLKSLAGLDKMPIIKNIYQVPSISVGEATEALQAYSHSLPGANTEDALHHLVTECFFQGRCHPLLLKAVGEMLSRTKGSRARARSDALESVSSRLRAGRINDDVKENVASVLRSSYDALNPTQQNILLLLGTCVPKEYFKKGCLSKAIEWLSFVYDRGSLSIGDVKEEMKNLQYFGLIEMKEKTVIVHEVQMMMIEKIVQDKEDVPRCWFFEGDVTTLSDMKWESLKYIYGFGEGKGKMKVFGRDWNLKRKGVSSLLHGRCEVDVDSLPLSNLLLARSELNVEVLRLSNMSPRTKSATIFLDHVKCLRHLELHNVSGVEKVGGWDQAPSLVSVVLSGCEGLVEIDAPTRHLLSLRKVRIEHLGKWKNADRLSELGRCVALESCLLSSNPLMRSFPSLALDKLRELDLSHCEGLQIMEGSKCALTALEELSLVGCASLKSIPDLEPLVKLRSLKLEGCVALREVKVGKPTLKTLEYLSLQYGRTNLATASGSALLMNAFKNLKALCLVGETTPHGSSSASRRLHAAREVMRNLKHKTSLLPIALPKSLEEMSLRGFDLSVPDVSALINLKQLKVDGSPVDLTAGVGALEIASSHRV